MTVRDAAEVVKNINLVLDPYAQVVEDHERCKAGPFAFLSAWVTSF
jgi:hypothetical protein